MNKIFLISFSRSGSDILKSKIQNLKWLVLATFLLATLSPAEAQQQKQIVLHWFPNGSGRGRVSVKKPSVKVCVSLDT